MRSRSRLVRLPMGQQRRTEDAMEPLEIQQDLLRMPEWARLSQIRQFQLSIEIFQRNADELLRFLGRLKTGPMAVHLWSLENRTTLEQALREVARLLLNLVASSFSLVDHARAFYTRNYAEHESLRDYPAEVRRRFADVPLCQFVQGLRNYFIHRRIPNVLSRVTLRQGEHPESAMLLAKQELQEGEWNVVARQYLESAPAEIDLLAVVSEYVRRVTDFYNWFFSRLNDVHAAELAAVAEKQDQLRRAVGEAAGHHLAIAIKIGQQIKTRPENFFLEFMDNETRSRICEANQEPEQRANALLDEVEKFSPPLQGIRGQIVELFRRYYQG